MGDRVTPAKRAEYAEAELALARLVVGQAELLDFSSGRQGELIFHHATGQTNWVGPSREEFSLKIRETKEHAEQPMSREELYESAMLYYAALLQEERARK